jgi:tight adherence protein C
MIYVILCALIGIAYGCCFVYAFLRKNYRGQVQRTTLIKGTLLAYPGLFMLEQVRYGYSHDFDRMMLQIYSKLISKQEAMVYYQLNLAVKVSMSWLCLIAFNVLMAMGLIDSFEVGVCFLVISGVLVMSNDMDARKLYLKREGDMVKRFPVFVNQLTLLVSAGMTVSGAWVFISENEALESAFVQEIRKSAQELSAGMPEISVYEDFAERCGLTSIRKFVTVLTQNIRKGTGDLVNATQIIATELWSDRKAMAIREAEKSSSKILLPMGIILIGLLLVVITPLALEFMTLL